ncbi:MAG: DUF938 domain-containing protein [Pseudomonadota bacterium]
MNKQHSPAALRNRTPIAQVLEGILPESGTVLEVASGSGEHVTHFARHFPQLTWLPSDPSAEARSSITDHLQESGLSNCLPPVALDASDPKWPASLPRETALHAIVCINMIHIAPWQACLGLLDGAAELLPAEAPLYLYGPYRRAGDHTSESNAAFDAQLRQRNSDWGVRNLETVCEEAQNSGFQLDKTVEMPANNLSVVFRRSAAARR